jgi:hypothetical protein
VVEAGSAHGQSDLARFVTGNTATTFAAASVPSGVYYVRVRAANLAGVSAASNEVTVAVNAPCQLPAASGLTADVTGTTVTVAWAGTNANSYRVEVGPLPGSSAYYDLDLGSATTVTASVAPGAYYVRVRGQNACGLGMPSNEVGLAVNVPAAPPDLRASVIGGNVTLRWTASAGPGVTGYVVVPGSAPGAFDLGSVNVGNVTTFTATGVPAGTYAVRVRAVNAAGQGLFSNELSVTVGPAPLGTSVVTFTGLPTGTAFVTHTEAGFTVDAVSGPWRSGPAPGWSNPTSAPVDGELRVVSAAGAPFRFYSVRLYSSTTPIPYVFRGVRNGVTVYTASGTVPNTFGNYASVPNPFATIVVDEVHITMTNSGFASNPVALDDIVLRP